MKLNKKKGFTLIELLAVIVVLAIIALIATPIVMNTIEKSKKGTAIESANNLIKSAEYYILQTKNRYGKVSVLDEKLNYSGSKPDLGEVEINKDGKSRIYTYINGYCVTKDYENKAPYATKTSKEECNWFATDNYETTEGSIITINNGNIKNYLIYGNSTQETRSGKNLFDKNNYSQDSINIVQFDITNLEIGKTYTFSSNIPITWFKISNARNGYNSVQYAETEGFTKYTFTMSRNSNIASSATQYLYLGIKGLTFVDTISDLDNYNIQIEEGSTATEYEEYGAMPSPEFPSEIKNTGDLITKDNCASYGSDACNNVGKYVVQVKTIGKNILNFLKPNSLNNYNNRTSISFEDGVYTINGYQEDTNIDTYFYANFVDLYLQKGEYTLSFDYKVEKSKANITFGSTDSNDQNFIIRKGDNSKVLHTTNVVTASENDDFVRVVLHYTIPADGNYDLRFGMDRPNFYGVGSKMFLKNAQLEYGNSATIYEPYREETTNIYLDEPLRKVGDYVDYIDYSNGKVVRNTNLKTFNGNEEWYQFGSNVALAKWDDGKTPAHGDNDITGIYSNLFRENKNAQTSANDNTFLTHNILNVDWIVINRNINVSDFKTLLANKNATFIYPLATPTEESISLPQIKTVEGTNYITLNTSTSASNLKIITEK